MQIWKQAFEHYAPKDIETGVTALLITDNERQAFEHVFDAQERGWWRDEDDSEPCSWLPDKPLTADEVARAEALGCHVEQDEWSWRVSGAREQVTQWARRCTEDPSDLYYGHTTRSYELAGECDDAQADWLLQALPGFVVDLRGVPTEASP